METFRIKTFDFLALIFIKLLGTEVATNKYIFRSQLAKKPGQ